MTGHSSQDNWFPWAIGVSLAFLLLLWLLTTLLQILIIPIFLIGFLLFIFGLINGNSEDAAWGIIICVVAIIGLFFVSLITHSPLWQPAESLGNSLGNMAQHIGNKSP